MILFNVISITVATRTLIAIKRYNLEQRRLVANVDCTCETVPIIRVKCIHFVNIRVRTRVQVMGNNTAACKTVPYDCLGGEVS